MTTESFHGDRVFFAPAFRIKLNGQDTGRELIADVLELSFTDDLENIDSFEFVLHDWDAARLRPKFSSPWDESGQLLTLSEGGPTVPVFEPGAKVSLFMGYTEEGELPLIMEGEVVSLTPSFPASGAPTCRVRALDAFQRGLQKIPVEGNYSGTAKAIVEQLCRENDVTVQLSKVEDEGSEEEDVDIEGVLYDEIQKRAKDYGLSMVTVPATEEGEKPTLFLSAPSEDTSAPVADFIWGRTLISFSPVLSAKGQVAEVVVRWGNPDAKGDGRIEVTKTWADVGLSPSALGPAGQADIDTAVKRPARGHQARQDPHRGGRQPRCARASARHGGDADHRQRQLDRAADAARRQDGDARRPRRPLRRHLAADPDHPFDRRRRLHDHLPGPQGGARWLTPAAPSTSAGSPTTRIPTRRAA